MDYEFLYRDGYDYKTTMYHVTIEKPGPRGGKRPSLIKAKVRADGYTDAVEYVEQEFLRRTRTTVVAG